MLKLRVFAMGVIAALNGTAYASEPIALTCSGTIWAPEHKIIDEPVSAQSLIIDLDGLTVRGSLGTFTITSISDSNISFQAPLQEKGRVTGTLTGGVDRISGFANLAASRNGGKSYVLIYQLNCKPARPLF